MVPTLDGIPLTPAMGRILRNNVPRRYALQGEIFRRTAMRMPVWVRHLCVRALLRKSRGSEISAASAHGFGHQEGDQDRLLALPAYRDIRRIFEEEKYRGAVEVRRLIW